MKKICLVLVALVALGFPRAALHASAAACCTVAQPAGVPASREELPGESLYHLGATWLNQDGATTTLADFAGKPVIVTMVFTHCAYACPRIVADLKAIESALPASRRADVRFVLASFDTARDTPERLRAWATEQNLGANWTLLHGDANAVRELSVALNIPFAAQPDGGFGHGNRIVLLDTKGVALTALEGLGAEIGPLVQAVARLPLR